MFLCSFSDLDPAKPKHLSKQIFKITTPFLATKIYLVHCGPLNRYDEETELMGSPALTDDWLCQAERL